MIPIMICLKLTGEHHVFYLQPRVGKNGKMFYVMKFATMLKDSPNLPGGYITQTDDPRILPMGRFLRKTKINELPQLLNILFGQMSFVGPRPIVRSHLDLYSDDARREILKLTPGLTGVGSLLFRDEEAILNRASMIGLDRKYLHDEVIAPYKGELELWYVKHRKLRLYFGLIFLTMFSLFCPNAKVYKSLLRDLPRPPKELDLLM